jgi:hypothetical protein
MTSPMLTLVSAGCVQCGSTRETVRRDRELQADAVCCEIAELIQLDPREPYAEDDYSEPLEPEVACYYCGNMTRSPLGSGKLVFCSKACWGDYAE